MRLLCTLVLALIVAGCATQPKTDLAAFRAASPRSIVIVPVVNKSLEIEAANYMLSTMTIPLAEQGFYVFPVNTVKVVLEQEGFYEPERVQQQLPADLAKFFDADAVLFVVINRWDAKYAVVTTVVTVSLSYRMFDRNGAPIWQADKQLQYSPDSGGGGSPLGMLVAAVVNAAITKAAPNYMPLARKANQMVFTLEGTALPPGPYSAKSP